MGNPWVPWLGELLLFIMAAQSVFKPAMPPVINDQPFNIFWAASTIYCKNFFNVNMNLDVFNIISNPLETQSGSTVTIFYPNELGYYPYFSQNGKSFNGGLPQNTSLFEHLQKAANDIAKAIPSWRSEGLIVIDWENWKPQWDRNWGNRIIFRNHSLALTRRQNPDWSDSEVRAAARQEFESAGKSFMNVTLALASEMRPKSLWGFYLYPDCYNYDYIINPATYTGSCPEDEILRNDQLLWLWEKSTALYPSIYLRKVLKSSLNALRFVHHRVREAMRIAEMARHDYVLPVFIFSRPFYLHSIEVLSEEDLVHTIGESAALGAAGVILWGGYEYSASKDACLSVQQSIQGPLGSYAVNVTSAAELCSESLCNNRGRCVRKTLEASCYLHMPGNSSKKFMPNKSFRFVTSKQSKLKTITDMKNGFGCHCYYGWHGDSCQYSSPDVLSQKNKSPDTDFNSQVFLGMNLSGILLKIFYFLILFQFCPEILETINC
ncbi:hyaluronidase-4-like [Dipodomys merriami]|uniref:hyaluronidase-4-like n=1 Tax=Dipodomys merriami TaxID=94247 RepID=UPI00385599B8